jgi:hypothetical protein
MKKIQLWSVESSGEKLRAEPVDNVNNTETEQGLEDLLASSPDLLMSNLTLIGRQVPTEAGALDLLGIDSDGRLVVLELKRGTLTREAVAQVLDYASDLAITDDDKFSRLIEEHSGRGGIDQIEDFSDWYSQEYPNEAGSLADPPKTVLVGLGADERARRIVNFLADAGIDIQLLTFHAFRSDGKLLLARQIESVAPATSRDRTAALSYPRSTRSRAYASPAPLPRPSQGSLPARAGSPLAGRDLPPLNDERNSMESSHPPIPIDQQGLVALFALSPSISGRDSARIGFSGPTGRLPGPRASQHRRCTT